MFTRYPLTEHIPLLGPVTFRKNVRAKHFRITVRGGGEVVVTVPRWGSLARAKAFVEDKREWIEKSNKKSEQKVRIRKMEVGEGGSRKKAVGEVLEEKVKQLAERYGFTYGEVKVKNITSRWGSCSRKGNLNFSLYLAFLPEHLVDYIVAHELCHTVEMNHGPRFWALLEKVYPEAKKADREMRKYEVI